MAALLLNNGKTLYGMFRSRYAQGARVQTERTILLREPVCYGHISMNYAGVL